MPRQDKTYPHITGLLGDEGENPGVLALTVILDPSPDYPAEARIIAGSPTESPDLPGYLPDLGGFATGIDGALQIIATLQQAISDIRKATGAARGEIWPSPPYLAGFERIGRVDSVGRRSLWLKEEPDAFELRAGREGGDAHVRVTKDNPQFHDLEAAVSCARFAAEWEDPNGFALAPLGIEVHGYEAEADRVQDEPDHATTVYLFRLRLPSGDTHQCRVLARHDRHFAVQYQRSLVIGTYFWDGVTRAATGVTADYVMAQLLASLPSLAFHPTPAQVDGNVVTFDLGDLQALQR